MGAEEQEHQYARSMQLASEADKWDDFLSVPWDNASASRSGTSMFQTVSDSLMGRVGAAGTGTGKESASVIPFDTPDSGAGGEIYHYSPGSFGTTRDVFSVRRVSQVIKELDC